MIQRPYNINIRGQCFDSQEEIKITWQVSGAIQTAFSIEIMRNSDNVVVYTLSKTNSYSPFFILPVNSLINGFEYKIKITVFDEKGNNASSDYEIFQTSSRPVVTVSPIGTVANSSYNFTATYSQSESIPMRSYIVILYDRYNNIADKSDLKITSPIEHIFYNLRSEEQYYIEFQVTSEKGLTATTGKISFDVLYTIPKININLVAENTSDAGIRISWNVVQIIGRSEGTTEFIDNAKIDVRNGKVIFDENFSFDKDWTLQLWISEPEHKEDLFILNGVNGQYRLQYNLVDECFHLYRTVNGLTNEWLSNQITGTDFYLFIQQIGRSVNITAELTV